MSTVTYISSQSYNEMLQTTNKRESYVKQYYNIMPTGSRQVGLNDILLS